MRKLRNISGIARFSEASFGNRKIKIVGTGRRKRSISPLILELKRSRERERELEQKLEDLTHCFSTELKQVYEEWGESDRENLHFTRRLFLSFSAFTFIVITLSFLIKK